MKRDIFVWQLFGFGAVSISGTLLHFLYEWTGRNPVAAVFSAVNESTWEHMKLLYFPLLAFALIQSIFFRDYKNFWRVKLACDTCGLVIIPVMFYTYNGAVGRSPDWYNIGIFFVAAAAVFALEWRLYRYGSGKRAGEALALAAFAAIGVLFAVFTFCPPHLPLFEDPITHTFGIVG